MPLNLELKIKLDSFDEVLSSLKEINAVYTAELNQKDIYYVFPDGLLKLRVQEDGQELISYNRDEKSGSRFSDYHILKIPGKGAEDFFDRIFETEAVVEKKRLLYMYNNTRVHLDEVYARKGSGGEQKKLGLFLELETLVLDGKKDAQTRYDDIISLLHLEPFILSQIKASYRDIILEKTNL